MKSDGLNSPLSPVLYGDIVLSKNTQYKVGRVKGGFVKLNFKVALQEGKKNYLYSVKQVLSKGGFMKSAPGPEVVMFAGEYKQISNPSLF